MPATMRRVSPLFALIVAILLFAAPGIASAESNGYVTQVASALKSTPVFVDPQASPTITQAQASQLASLIHQRGKPVYLVLMNNGQVKGFSSPGAFMNQVHLALGGSGTQVIGISTGNGFYAQGFGAASSLSNQANNLAGQAAKQHGKNDVNGAYTDWINGVANLRVVTSGSSSNTNHSSNNVGVSNAASNSNSTPWGLIVLFVILGLLVLVGIIFFVRSRRKKTTQTRQDKLMHDRLENQRDSLNDNLVALDPQVRIHPEAQSDYDKAMRSVQSGDASLSDGDLEEAKRYLDQAERSYQNALAATRPQSASAFVSASAPRQSAPTSGSAASAPSGSAQAPRAAKVQRPDGSTVVINNTTYQPQQTQMPGYGNYYGGGYYGGMYYGAGYYSDPFWNYMVMEELFDHDGYGYGGGDYREGYQEGREDAQQQDQDDSSGNAGDNNDWNQAGDSGDTATDNSWSNDTSSDTPVDNSWSDSSTDSADTGWSSDTNDTNTGGDWGSDTGSDFSGGDTGGDGW